MTLYNKKKLRNKNKSLAIKKACKKYKCVFTIKRQLRNKNDSLKRNKGHIKMTP